MKIKMNKFWVTYVVADSMFFFSFMNTKMKKLLPNCDYIQLSVKYIRDH